MVNGGGQGALPTWKDMTSSHIICWCWIPGFVFVHQWLQQGAECLSFNFSNLVKMTLNLWTCLFSTWTKTGGSIKSRGRERIQTLTLVRLISLRDFYSEESPCLWPVSCCCCFSTIYSRSLKTCLSLSRQRDRGCLVVTSSLYNYKKKNRMWCRRGQLIKNISSKSFIWWKNITWIWRESGF